MLEDNFAKLAKHGQEGTTGGRMDALPKVEGLPDDLQLLGQYIEEEIRCENNDVRSLIRPLPKELEAEIGPIPDDVDRISSKQRHIDVLTTVLSELKAGEYGPCTGYLSERLNFLHKKNAFLLTLPQIPVSSSVGLSQLEKTSREISAVRSYIDLLNSKISNTTKQS